MSYRPADSKFTTLTQGGNAVVDTANTVTLTNKTLTSPVITSAKQLGLNLSAKSADYTVLDDDGISVINMTTSTTTRTVTLPTAADNTGRTLVIKKVDSGSGRVIVDGEGSETIDGFATVIVPLQNDFVTVQCTGSAWTIINRRDVTGWTSYTPTFTAGFGTVSNEAGFWRRNGSSIEVRGYATFGTVTAAYGAIYIPNSLNTAASLLSKNNSTSASGEYVGRLFQEKLTGGRNGILVTAPATGTDAVYLTGNISAGDTLLPALVSTYWDSGENFSFRFEVPITEWQDA